MSAPKWTSGEWSAQMVGRPMGDHRIPTMWWLRFGAVSLSTDNPADASLCAAAPDLYAALEALVAEYEGLPHSLGYAFTHLPTARDALRKARGEA